MTSLDTSPSPPPASTAVEASPSKAKPKAAAKPKSKPKAPAKAKAAAKAKAKPVAKTKVKVKVKAKAKAKAKAKTKAKAKVGADTERLRRVPLVCGAQTLLVSKPQARLVAYLQKNKVIRWDDGNDLSYRRSFRNFPTKPIREIVKLGLAIGDEFKASLSALGKKAKVPSEFKAGLSARGK